MREQIDIVFPNDVNAGWNGLPKPQPVRDDKRPIATPQNIKQPKAPPPPPPPPEE